MRVAAIEYIDNPIPAPVPTPPTTNPTPTAPITTSGNCYYRKSNYIKHHNQLS